MPTDEMEEYQAIFFAECADLLVDLQDRFDEMADGAVEPETINAAFRAVHSIKGGASAFGFDGLVGFAHVFETTLDRLRSGTLELTQELLGLLQRAGDIIALLVEQARDGIDVPQDRIDRVLGELREASGIEAAEECEDAPAGDAPAAEPEASEAGPEEDAAAEREVRLRLAIRDGFHRRGHDLLRVIRGLREFGLTGVEPPDSFPPPAEFDLHAPGDTWQLKLVTALPVDEIAAYFDVYDGLIEVEIDADEASGQEPARDDAPPASAQTQDHPPEGSGADGAQHAVAPAQKRAAPKPKDAEAASRPVKRSGDGERTVKSLRVDISRIDRLVNLVGEIVITQAVLAQKLSENSPSGDLELGHAVENMARHTRELQDSVMAIRAQPIKSVFQRMPRLVRDLADTLQKDVRIQLSGEQTEVDTTVIEELAEPLTHMLRNSMDHGIEPTAEERIAAGKPAQGTIHLSAEHRGERVIITVADDGRGIDREKVRAKAIERGLISPDDNLGNEEIDNLIFHPGFSTANEISSVSGRGVGMDVVQKKIQSLGGRCTLKNQPGKSLSFEITLPLTLAILDGMAIGIGEERFILPLSSVVEAVRVEQAQIQLLPGGGQVLPLRGQYVPILSLRETLGLKPSSHREEMAILVDAESNGLVAVLVDELLGQRQVVLKSLEANYQRVEGVSGATILGDGRVALILDIPALIRSTRIPPRAAGAKIAAAGMMTPSPSSIGALQ
ncbi:MAG: chemotaxis protein CheA [Alphaproteobacteria bacterium]|nr:MAG: chemotaxis protein CheA [Alphaproteobacteria bacterium]